MSNLKTYKLTDPIYGRSIKVTPKAGVVMDEELAKYYLNEAFGKELKFDDLVNDNNYITDSDGNIAQVEENIRDEKGMHTIKYRVKKSYLSNSLVDDIESL